jgi:hypothetical protein
MEHREYKSTEGKKVVLVGLCITALGMLGVLGWNKFREYRDRKREESDPENLPASIPKSLQKPTGFPLKQGSTGAEVKALQKMLIEKYGASILPKYGADGNFGRELTTALKAKGLPEVIDASTFQLLTRPKLIDAAAKAKSLYEAALKRDFVQVLALLKQLKSANDYATVSENFKQYRLNGVRQTLVNGLLSNFNSTQKQQIQSEFLRMGLKFDGSKWSLSGIAFQPQIITTAPTLVYKDKNTAVDVPVNFILGYAIAEQNGYTVFENINKKRFLVKTAFIKYI